MHISKILVLTSALCMEASATLLYKEQASTPLPVGVPVMIIDFAGNALDLAYGSARALTPVQCLVKKPGEIAQTWNLTFSGGQTYTVQNPAAKTFLSFSTAGTPVSPTCSQLCGNPTTAVKWKIIPSTNGTGFNIIEPGSNQAVMGWPFSRSGIVGSTAPVTLQNFDPNEKQMIFTFVAGASSDIEQKT
ncbi:hypothetical protein C8R43DRAFT_1234431 [Mycena crocata]|nr:hypothetical protein C8R43DRAFT_1234431 [Mycena crocata]